MMHHEGGTYVIDMVSSNPKALDPFLKLLDASGKTLAADDDSGGGLNARIIFLAPATGTYRMVATSFDSAGVGPFTLAVKRDDARQADALEERVQFLNSAGKTAEALAAAHALLKARERLQGPPHWQTVDARWEVRKLEKIASLPASSRAELAEGARMSTRAVQLSQQDRYAQAIPLFERALAIHRKLVGEEHPDTALSYNNLAYVLHAQGKYAEAAPPFEKALAIRRNILGDEHPGTAWSYHNLALNLKAQGKYSEAASLLERALAIRCRIFGDEHPDTAASYNGVAANLREQHKYTEAAPLFEKALTIRCKVLGDEHADVAESYNNLADNLSAQGKYTEATPLFEKALAIRRKLGEEHRSTARSYSNLADNLSAQCKYGEAALLLERALAIHRRILGDEHPDTVLSYENLALNLRVQGKYAQAAGVYEKVLAIRRRILGEEHPNTAASYSGLAANLYAQGRYAEAALLCEKTLTIHRKFLDEEDPRMAQCYNDLAANLNGEAKYAEAARLWEKALAIYRKKLGDQHVQTALTYNNLAYNLNAQGKYAEATPLYRKALAIRCKILGEEHPDTALVYNNLARNLNAQGQYDEATLLDEKALAIRRRILGEEHVNTASSYNHRAANLYARGRYAEAAEAWRSGSRVYSIARLRSAPTGLGRASFRPRASPALSVSACLARNGKPLLAWQDLGSLPPPPDHGVLIVKIMPGSNAAKGGLRVDDVLLSYDGKKLDIRGDLSLAVKNAAGKLEVLIRVWRDGKILSLKVAAGPLGVGSRKEPAAQVILTKREADSILRSVRGRNHPPLPGTRAEVAGIARLFPQARTLLQSDASEQQLYDLAKKGELKKYRFLHFATHGEVDDRISFNSALILAQDRLPNPAEAMVADAFLDGRLTAEEISKWTRDGQPLLDADLVVLSACQSGLGREAGGEGYLGFSQALFLAGARSLVVSLWKVDDTATALLMVRFYENLLSRRAGLKSPMPKAEALSEAKRWLRNLTKKEAETLAKNLPAVERIGTASGRPRPRTASDYPYEHPYYWAAFILIGDPR